jgi:hypothetical protein
MRNTDPDRNGLVFKGRKSFLRVFNAAGTPLRPTSAEVASVLLPE